ncbi:hypothetical protein [Paractinoplanes lichenicola]|uniref:Secreted protein n=1 Tax=Paractinoplanes lichenicola TaxID=2802976 RepID=A0ABS1W5Z5_9ACTN|nr:hypothetical protein [Actinoplanes lichenicola]MBL7262160.1 hypothetical protein [Actinoplanes lichenicola]
MKHKSRGIAAAVASIAGIASLGFMPGSAQAAPDEVPSLEVRSARITGADILKYSHRADEAGMNAAGTSARTDAAGKRSVGAKEKARVADYMNRQARSGRLLRSSDVRVATVPSPVSPGHDITLVWGAKRVPSELRMQQVGDDENGAMGLAIEFAPDGTEETRGAEPAQLSGGSGYDNAINPKNMYTKSIWTGCANAYWDSKYSSTDYHVESCYEKWAQSGTNHWVYNRWGLFTRPDSSTVKPDIRDFTIRSRPWKQDLNHINYVSKLNSWAPPGPTSKCETKTYTVGGGAAGGSASVGIPIQTCSTTILHIDTGQKMIGIGVEGHEPTGRQARLDVGGDYNATNKTAVPVWADYAWATVQYLGPQGTTRKDEYVLKDSGW